MAGNKTRIMYVERITGSGHDGTAFIGRVSFSKTGKTIYFRGKKLQRGTGVRGNYFEVDSGVEYWISGPKKNGQDRHWASSNRPVKIDQNVVDEYWRDIRKCELPADPFEI